MKSKGVRMFEGSNVRGYFRTFLEWIGWMLVGAVLALGLRALHHGGWQPIAPPAVVAEGGAR